MVLTQKQEGFCVAYVESGNATSAYRLSYKCAKMADKTVNECASKLLADHKIAARIKELRAPALEKAQLTLETHLNDLKRLRDLAEASEKYGPAVAAEISRGKASGLYVDKLEVNDVTPKSIEQIDVRLAELLAKAALKQ